MLADLNFLLDKPHLLLIVLAVGAMIGIGVERFWTGIEREQRRAYWRGRTSNKPHGGKVSCLNEQVASRSDLAADQLRVVMKADYSARPLLNSGERRLLSHLDRILAEDSPGWRVMGQVSLGEILASKDAAAYGAINSKRVDLLIVDGDCNPLHAIEFQGTGHHAGQSTAARDAIKKEALRRAGIGFVEVCSGDMPSDLRAKIRKLTNPSLPGTAKLKSISAR